MPATRDTFRDIFDPKMFMARDSRGGNYKSIVSTPPLDEGAQTIPSTSIFRKLEEMVTCTDTVRILVKYPHCTPITPSRKTKLWKDAATVRAIGVPSIAQG